MSKYTFIDLLGNRHDAHEMFSAFNFTVQANHHYCKFWGTTKSGDIISCRVVFHTSGANEYELQEIDDEMALAANLAVGMKYIGDSPLIWLGNL